MDNTKYWSVTIRKDTLGKLRKLAQHYGERDNPRSLTWVIGKLVEDAINGRTDARPGIDRPAER